MPQNDLPHTLNTNATDLRAERFESAWLNRSADDPPPCWQDHLPADNGANSAEFVFFLLQMDIECRVKSHLPALLSENYFKHPCVRLSAAQQVELIRWEYQQRWQNGERAQRREYQAAFPEHADALNDLQPSGRCSHCGRAIALDETGQTFRCPHCDGQDTLAGAFPPFESPLASADGSTCLDLRGYELIEPPLGQGGMGAVYRAVDPALGRELAVKVMKGDYSGSDEAERRFVREARVTGSLQHPGIVPVYNLGRLADGRLHYTMRLVRGRTLADILKEEAGKAERWPDLLTIFVKICDAVAYAHSKRVIHRDLKPGNVMVGRFGEVQVMDWGLAKLLTPGDANGISAPSAADSGSTRIHTEAMDTPMGQTRMGREMGTPSYMPPEQALGEWDAVDERADVFALGAILCEILTGLPPYHGRDSMEALRKAKRGDREEALARLESCGADAALVALCRDSLATKREDRPHDAEAVARRVTAYQTEVQERLRRAELERAAAQVKAAEERKRRRLTLVLASAVLLAVLTGGGAFLLVQKQKLARQEQTARLVQQALGQATALRDQAQAAPLNTAAQRERAENLWRDSLAAADRAEQALADGEADAETTNQAGVLAELRRQAADAQKDRRMLQQLERAHDLEMEIQESDYARRRRVEEFVFGLAAAPAYAAAFREYGIDVEALSTEEAVARIRQRPIRFQLAVALDDWYFIAPQAAGGRLLDISRAVDPDPLRGRVRDAIARKDRETLKQLAKDETAIELPVPTLILLAYELHHEGLRGEALRLMQRARSRHPDDFWFNDVFGLLLNHADPPDYTGSAHCFAAAAALRPSSPLGWSNLGGVLIVQGRFDEAVAALREAIRRRPDFLFSYQTLTEALIAKGEPDKALQALREPLRRHPHSPTLGTAMGHVLLAQGKTREAISAFRKVLERNPEWVYALVILAQTLSTEGAFDEALALLDRGKATHPDLHFIPQVRGIVLANRGDADGALEAYRRAVQLSPGDIYSCSGLAVTLAAKGEAEAALRLHRKVIGLAPENATLHADLADSLRGLGRLYEAESEYRLAIQLHPSFARAYNSLGLALLEQRKIQDAERIFREGLKLQPHNSWFHAHLGLTLSYRRDLSGAAAALAEAVRLKPDEGIFHDYLGHIPYNQGRYAEAIPHYQEAIRLKEAKLGADHQETLRSMLFLGNAYREAGQPKNAVPLLEKVLKRGRQLRGGLPPALAEARDALAVAYERDGQSAKAEPIFRDLVKHAQQQYGPDDPRTTSRLAQLGANLLMQKKFADAESVLRQCLKIRERKQPAAWNTFNTRSTLGEALLRQKKYAEAEPLLVQGYEGMQQRVEEIPPFYRRLRMTEALGRLAQLYDEWNKKDKADEWRKKLEQFKKAKS